MILFERRARNRQQIFCRNALVGRRNRHGRMLIARDDSHGSAEFEVGRGKRRIYARSSLAHQTGNEVFRNRAKRLKEIDDKTPAGSREGLRRDFFGLGQILRIDEHAVGFGPLQTGFHGNGGR